MPPEENVPLLHQLYRKASILEYQYRLKWRPNSIARTIGQQPHYAVSDYFPDKSETHRVTFESDTRSDPNCTWRRCGQSRAAIATGPRVIKRECYPCHPCD
jgi:hypothetical protein